MATPAHNAKSASNTFLIKAYTIRINEMFTMDQRELVLHVALCLHRILFLLRLALAFQQNIFLNVDNRHIFHTLSFFFQSNQDEAKE